MLKETLSRIYENDLRKVITEIEAYESEADIWQVADGITNSAGNLALHLVGNINHFFGANLGGTDYIRERDLEFSDKNISRAELVERLEKTFEVLKDTFEKLSNEDFHQDYPEAFGGETQKTLPVVVYMLSHLNYHLGQINYHRRLISKQP
jgi:uncharacterized damage-inducible protein DinB